MKQIFLSSILFFSFSYLYSQSTTISEQLKWSDTPVVHDPFEIDPLEIHHFEGALFQSDHPTLPVFTYRFPVSSKGKVSVQIVEVQYEALDKKPTEDDQFLSEQLTFQQSVSKDRQQFFGNIAFIPIVKSGSTYQKVVNFKLKINFTPSSSGITRGPENTYNSVLSEGDIYKIAVTKNGMYRLNYDFLKNSLGISNLDNIDPRKIQFFGNGGGMLPELNDEFRYDDLEENAIQIVGEGDGSFDSGDYILFYGEGSSKWKFDATNQEFVFEKNLFDDKNYYFIKISTENGKRIATQTSVASTQYTSTTFNDYGHFEEDKRNLLFDGTFTQGSGKNLYGDLFSSINPDRSYSDKISFSNLVPGQSAIFTTEFAARSGTNSSFSISTQGNQYSTTMGSVNMASGEATFAKIGKIRETFVPQSGDFDFSINYSAPTSESEGWLDFVTVNVQRSLTMSGSQMDFRDIESLNFSATTFELSNATDITIWDITNPQEAMHQEATGSPLKSFGVNTTILRNFIAFNPASNDLFSAEAIGKVENQNLHGIDNVDLVIIYANGYEAPVQRLVDHRVSHDGLSVATVRLNQIYNEFSGGGKDISAIRDFAKMLHERSDKFQYLLLFGDGSFDFKNLYALNGKDEIFHNLIPAYETDETLDPILAYPSDDFFGLLSEGEGTDKLSGDLDIGVGRIPIRTIAEADAMVDKIIRYDIDPQTLGDWRIRLTFTGDDEDGSIHTKQADSIADLVDTTNQVYNLDKIFFDAYQQVATPGGERFPAATEALNQNMFKGHLILNYLGHGGSVGWAQERVLRQQHISNWENLEKLPLLVTATCSFTGYDEPSYTTAGELSFLNDKGGVIGLFTTTRAVYSSQNEKLTRAAFQRMFDRENGETLTLGEILRRAKNSSGNSENNRKFSLIGDPSQKLAIPRFNVTTTKINGVDITSGQIDTLQALQKVTIEGQIEDFNGNLLNDFNGKVFPTIYDKPITASTLGQDAGSPIINFKLQKNIIFKGAASVVNGKFQFTFVVPKDINYEYGAGKISYYAHDGVALDAAGFFENIIIGGTNPNAIVDDQPPLVEVFMNNEDFVFGGITNENPILLVKLSDDNGINVVGNSIGHDLTGVLDQNTQNTYQLNDFYESELDDHTKGTVRYPLFNLEEGKHNIKVRAWDIANNSAEGYTEFIVAKSEEVALSHVLNYPNPFMDNTSFQFEHNLPGQVVDIQIRIFTVAGNLVKTIEHQAVTDGTRITDIKWNGTDDFGDQLARGVYLYKVQMAGTNPYGDTIKSESEFEKLVILK